jgi:hypothetical protein
VSHELAEALPAQAQVIAVARVGEDAAPVARRITAAADRV